MNERIRELEKQSYTEVMHEMGGTYMAFDKEKFAELIVRASVGVADDYVKDCTCEEHINCKHPRSAIGRKIREHFGVES
jgi:hypothetical protein